MKAEDFDYPILLQEYIPGIDSATASEILEEESQLNCYSRRLGRYPTEDDRRHAAVTLIRWYDEYRELEKTIDTMGLLHVVQQYGRARIIVTLAALKANGVDVAKI